MFQFKQFTIRQDRSTLKVGTDGVVIGAWVNVAGAKRILDVGTGTGLLALMCAQRNADALIDAIEIDDASAEQAAENAAASPWADRIRVHRMDVKKMRSAEKYDLIICNPPFYAGEMASPDLRKGLAKHSSELDLGTLIGKVDQLLSEEGKFACIIPIDREREMLQLADRSGFQVKRRCQMKYLEQRPAKRLLLEFDRHAEEVDEELLIIEYLPGDFTVQYKYLLKDFILNL